MGLWGGRKEKEREKEKQRLRRGRAGERLWLWFWFWFWFCFGKMNFYGGAPYMKAGGRQRLDAYCFL